VTSEIASTPADLASDLKIKAALQRRSIALELGRAMTFEVHQEWVEELFQHYQRPAPRGYATVNYEQLIAADKQLFTEMARFTRGGISQNAGGVFPLDAALQKAMFPTAVQYLLMPMMSTSSSQTRETKWSRHHSPSGKSDGGKSGVSKGGGKSGGSKGGGKSGGAKGGGKKGGKKGFLKLPWQLEGCHSRDSEGNAICYDYNLQGCSLAVSNGACSKGMRVCCIECPDGLVGLLG
jgi:uncharacterized membrane protein YgcG